MKKQNSILITILTVLAFAAAINANAQTKVWSIGPEAGVSLSKYGNDANANDFKPGGVAGVSVTYSIINTFAVTGKFLFHQKGATFPSSNTKQTLNYIEVPIVGRYFFNREGKFRPNIFVGPSFSFLTGVRNKIGNNSPENIQSYKDYYNGFDLGVTTGAGCNIRIVKETYLVLDARYIRGITNVNKSGDKINNQSIALTAGVSFGF